MQLVALLVRRQRRANEVCNCNLHSPLEQVQQQWFAFDCSTSLPFLSTTHSARLPNTSDSSSVYEDGMSDGFVHATLTATKA